MVGTGAWRINRSLRSSQLVSELTSDERIARLEDAVFQISSFHQQQETHIQKLSTQMSEFSSKMEFLMQEIKNLKNPDQGFMGSGLRGNREKVIPGAGEPSRNDHSSGYLPPHRRNAEFNGDFQPVNSLEHTRQGLIIRQMDAIVSEIFSQRQKLRSSKVLGKGILGSGMKNDPQILSSEDRKRSHQNPTPVTVRRFPRFHPQITKNLVEITPNPTKKPSARETHLQSSPVSPNSTQISSSKKTQQRCSTKCLTEPLRSTKNLQEPLRRSQGLSSLPLPQISNGSNKEDVGNFGVELIKKKKPPPHSTGRRVQESCRRGVSIRPTGIYLNPTPLRSQQKPSSKKLEGIREKRELSHSPRRAATSFSKKRKLKHGGGKGKKKRKLKHGGGKGKKKRKLKHGGGKGKKKPNKKPPFSNGYGLSSALILNFPPNFVRQLSNKARRNCGNIGVAQVVAASWANSSASDEGSLPSTAAVAVDGAVVVFSVAEEEDAAVGACSPLLKSQGRLRVEEEKEDGDFKLNPWLSAAAFLGGEFELLWPISLIKNRNNARAAVRILQVAGVIKSYVPNGLVDLFITLKDPTRIIGASIHRNALLESNLGGDISVGCVFILKKACSQVASDEFSPLSKRLAEFRDSFWRFLRPHTISGTALGSTALVARALIENPNLINWCLTIKALYGLIALICGNGYIVGIN